MQEPEGDSIRQNSPVTLRQWLDEATLQLAQLGIDSAALEAQVLAAHALSRDRAWLLAHSNEPVQDECLDVLLARRLRREPLAYIVGVREFYGRPFAVSPSVLIPRQETETLVDAGLDVLRDRKKPRILDLGTGSGCLAITLSLERPDAQVNAVDISPRALAIARQNSESLGAKLRLLESDLFAALPRERFDLIVTNPPYVSLGAVLEPEVRDWEPGEALFAGPEGLDLYIRLAREARPWLEPDGLLLVELGDGACRAVKRVFEVQGWQMAGTWRDLMGMERVLGVR